MTSMKSESATDTQKLLHVTSHADFVNGDGFIAHIPCSSTGESILLAVPYMGGASSILNLKKKVNVCQNTGSGWTVYF